ncbi:MAG: efflux transporter outer membrane subunit [bacterium]|nr:efflux transporter outer membrane subunit [bacterium]
MFLRKFNKLTLLPWVALLVWGCSPHSPMGEPGTGLESDRFEQSEQVTYSDPGRWWLQLGSKELEALMERAFTKNPGLRAAQARIEQRLAATGISFAALLPSANADFTAAKSANRSTGVEVQSTSFSIELQASYDLDLFGKNSANLKAAELELLASLEAYKQQLTLLGQQVAKAWFGLASIQAQLEFAQETLLTDQANLELIEQSYKLGTAQAAEVLQAREQLTSTELRQVQLRVQQLSAQQSLRQLVGDYPSAADLAAQLDLGLQLPPLQPGLPSGLLKRRPDLRQALLQLKAQDHRIAAAVADRFPRLSLTASTGYQSTELSSLSEPNNAFWNLVANLSVPIFDGGRRRAEVRRQEALLEEQLANYRQSLLGAFGEVESALVQLKQQDLLLELRQRSVVIAQQRLALTKSAFVQGVMTFDQVIAAQKQFVTAQTNWITDKRGWIDLRVDLYTALGGDWTAHYLESLGAEIKDINREEP